MDLKAVDQMFELDARHLVSEYVTYRRNQVSMKNEIAMWLADHKATHTYRNLGGLKALLHVHDRSLASLFKLTWM